MAQSRSKEVERLAGMFKALSNANRLEIFSRVMAAQSGGGREGSGKEGVRCCVGELGGNLGLAASTVSHHLRELRQAGLVRVERRGKAIECCADADALDALADFLRH